MKKLNYVLMLVCVFSSHDVLSRGRNPSPVDFDQCMSVEKGFYSNLIEAYGKDYFNEVVSRYCCKYFKDKQHPECKQYWSQYS